MRYFKEKKSPKLFEVNYVAATFILGSAAVSDGASSLASPASCELRSVIRFLAAKKKSAKEIHEELCQVYGEECMSSGMVRRWVRDFKNGRTDVHDEARAGRPSASDETIA
ncbi:HTH_48 domain-containing protein [Trichonephila clavipes]|nr:HTH_48 domain-containing protein [Trichonephila clavipes]